MAISCIIGAGAIVWAVRHLTSQPDPRYALGFAYGLQLPIPVVADVAHGWLVLILFWLTIAVQLVLGWRLAVAIGTQHSITLWYVLGAIGVIGIVYSLFPILVSSDIYAYVVYGRLYGVYHENPYFLTQGFDVRHEAILFQCFRFYGNPPPGDDYGPLWTLMASVIGRLEAGLSLFWQLWTHRIVALGAVAVSAAGIWKILATAAPPKRAKRVAMFAFHPVVLFEAASGGHNDAIMLAPAIWSFALADAYPLAAGILLGASMGVKYISVIALPFLLIRIARKSGALRAVLAAMLALAVPLVCFAPFWHGVETFRPMANQLNDYRTSLIWLLAVPMYVFQRADAVVFDHLTWIRFMQLIIVAGAVGVIATSVIRYARSLNSSELFRATTSAVWAFANVYPWYVAWLSPALAARSIWARYVWWFGALVFLHYLQDVVRQPDTTGEYYLMMALLAFVTVVFLAVPVVLARRGGGQASGTRS
jgi:hypothetical protein